MRRAALAVAVAALALTAAACTGDGPPTCPTGKHAVDNPVTIYEWIPVGKSMVFLPITSNEWTCERDDEGADHA